MASKSSKQLADAKTKEMLDTLMADWLENLDEFVEFFLSHHLGAEIPQFHRELYGWLNKESRVLVAAPRGFAKSYLSTFFNPIHNIVYGKHNVILIVSATKEVAVGWCRKIRNEFDSNLKLRKYYGVGPKHGGKWTEECLEFNNGVELRAIGAGSQIRGRRPDLIILDDLETEETAASRDLTDRLKQWIRKACLPSLTPDGQFIMIGTVITFTTIIDEFLSLMPDAGWKTMRWQAYIDAVEEPGHELWPAQWPHERLQRIKKEIGSLAFSSEYMNTPVQSEQATIHESQIRIWEDLPKNLSMVLTIDPAYSEESTADYKVAYLVGIDELKRRFCVSYIRTRAKQGEFIDAALNLYLTYKDNIMAVGVPRGREREFYDKFLEKSTDRGLNLPITEVKNAFSSAATGVTIRNKVRRIIAALQPLFEQGKYWLHQSHESLKDELLHLTPNGTGKHDDLIDAATYAEQIFSTTGYMPTYIEEQGGRYGELLPDEQEDNFDDGYWN